MNCGNNNKRDDNHHQRRNVLRTLPLHGMVTMMTTTKCGKRMEQEEIGRRVGILLQMVVVVVVRMPLRIIVVGHCCLVVNNRQRNKRRKTKSMCGAIPCGVCDTRIPCASSLDTEELSCHHQPFDGHQNLKKEPTYNSMQRKTPRSRRKEERQI